MTHPEKTASPPRHRRQRARRLAAAIAASAPLIAALSLVGGPADAALPTIGPVDPATHFPAFYTDSNGLSLQLCMDPGAVAVNCLTTRAELLNAGADGEAFYASATSDVGDFSAEYALEAAYAADGPGQEIVFVRTRYTGKGAANTKYTFTGPYGTDTCTTNATGTLPRNGCTFDEGGAVGGDFTSAKASNRIGPFLAWDTTADRPVGYIGNPNIPHAVTGSPTGFNTFRVQGPGIAGTCTSGLTVINNCAESDQFLVAGQVASGAQGSAAPNPLSFGSSTATTTDSVTYTNIGNADLTVTAATIAGDPELTATGTDCTGAVLAAGDSCSIGVQFAPVLGKSSSATITFTDSNGTHTVPVTGKGAQAHFAAPASLSFGNVGVGTTMQKSIKVTNDGDASMTISTQSVGAGAHGVSIMRAPDTTCDGSLAVNASCTLAVAFRPTSVGTKSTQLSLGSADGAADVVNISGTGVDVTAPTILVRGPAARATAANRTGNIAVTFDEGVTGLTATTFRLTNLKNGRAIRSVRTSNASKTRWTLNPNVTLAAGTRYRVDLVGGARQIRDLHGVALKSTSWTFRTR
jgi:hypothetical protein